MLEIQAKLQTLSNIEFKNLIIRLIFIFSCR